MIRTLAFVSGLGGAVALSQFPEFSQQYLQRLSGAVGELQVVVTGFDLAAAGSGKSREEALAAMSDTGFDGDLKRTLAGSITRYERLQGDLAALKEAAPLQRLAQPWHMADRELIRRTWEDFRPAVPVTSDGLLSAGVGFGLGWALISLILGLARRPFRKRAA